ncbi:MAG: response regulator transcription factor [Halobacteriales archaeon]
MSGRVVIADDDETIRSILRHKLGSEGFDLQVCEDGGEVRDALDDPEADPDVAILDVMMPRLQGTQVLRMVRRGELAVDPEIPVIMLTSRGREDDVLEGLELGADEYITKPFSPAELLARVENLLEE